MFKSRMSRKIFLGFQLFFWTMFFVSLGLKEIGSMIIALLSLINIYAIVCRLHDIDKSGLWVLLVLIPFMGFIMSVYLLFAKGTQGRNRFGEQS